MDDDEFQRRVDARYRATDSDDYPFCRRGESLSGELWNLDAKDAAAALRDAPVDWLRDLAALFVYDGAYGEPKQYGLVERTDGTSWATAFGHAYDPSADRDDDDA